MVEPGASSTNLRGDVTVNNVQLGEYVLAIRDSELATGYSPDQEIKVFPNPASNTVTIDLPDNFETGTTISIVDGLGRTTMEQQILQGQTVLDLSGFNSGMYRVVLRSPYKKTVIRKLEVMR